MIYLIDDNQHNHRAHLGIDFVDNGSYAAWLTSIEKVERKEKASDISHLNFLKKADCILLHATTEDWDEEKGFLSGSLSNVRKIKENIADFGDEIPLVLFSNGMSESVYSYQNNPGFIAEMNKNVFYERLCDFVEYYKDIGKIELRVLVWGKNFKAKEVSVLANELLKGLALCDDTQSFDTEFIINSQRAFKTFVELSFPDDSYTSVLNNLKNRPVTINELRDKINSVTESFLKYGKNIYPWE